MSTNFNTDPVNEQWVTQAEAARLRGVTRQAIGKLVSRQKLKILEIGGVTFVSKEDVLNFVPDKSGRPKKDAIER